MKALTWSMLCVMITFVALTAFAHKQVASRQSNNKQIIATYVLSDPKGISGKMAFDEKGNAIQVFPTYTNGLLQNIDYKAYSKKEDKNGEKVIYSEGSLPEVAGLNSFTMPIFLSQGVGGFDGKNLLLKLRGTSFDRYIMYSLGNNGATIIDQIEFNTSVAGSSSSVYMYKGKIVAQYTEPSNGLTKNVISIYNKKLKLSRQGGTITAGAGGWQGKAAAFLTYSGNTNCSISVVKP